MREETRVGFALSLESLGFLVCLIWNREDAGAGLGIGVVVVVWVEGLVSLVLRMVDFIELESNGLI